MMLSDPQGATTVVRDSVEAMEMTVLLGGAIPRPLGFHPVLAVSDDRLFLASPRSTVIEVTDYKGHLERRMSVPASVAVAPSDESYSRALAEVAGLVPPAFAETLMVRLKGLPKPGQYPPIRRMFVDRDGNVWVSVPPMSDTRTRLVVLARDGSYLATVAIPLVMDITHVDEDRVVGIRTSKDGATEVVVVRVRRKP